MPTPVPPNADELAAVRAQWGLRPGVTYLNHGSFGPSPRPVVEARERWYERLESNPMEFFHREVEPAMAAARARLGRLLNAPADDFILVDNATYGINVVARSTRLRPGDEVLLTDHEYGSVRRLWERDCQRAGAKLVVQPLPCPFRSAEETADALLAGASDRTRLLVFSHITSPTGIILPAELICRRARERGIAVCIDGPHAVGMVPVDLAALGCDYYAMSCHKWVCAPFGSGALYVHPRAQGSIEPPVLSWGRLATDRDPASWRDEFNWVGTRDPSAWLTIPTAIDFLESLGWEKFRGYSHELVRYARHQIGELTGLEPLVPDSRAWYGSMNSLPIPEGEVVPLQQALREQYQIEIPAMTWNGRRFIRPSCHVYSTAADIDKLVAALRKLL